MIVKRFSSILIPPNLKVKVTKLTKGVYFFKLVNNNNIQTLKIIKNRKIKSLKISSIVVVSLFSNIVINKMIKRN